MTDVSGKSSRSGTGTTTSDNTRTGDTLGKLHKMSTTAGLGSADYTAINSIAVACTFLGIASAAALIDNALLIIPACAVVCGVIALWQIRGSGGTQKGIAWVTAGLVLAVGLGSYVLVRAGTTVSERADDEKVLIGIVDQFGKTIAAQKFDDAYMMMSLRFRERVSKAQFEVLWKYIGGAAPNPFTLTSIASNGRVDFQENPATDEEMGLTMCILTFEGKPTDDRIEFYFRRVNRDKWELENIPSFFPADPEKDRRKPS